MTQRTHKMPRGGSTRSLYRKIEIVVAEAHRTAAASLDQLVMTIGKGGDLDFTCYRANSSGKVTLETCSTQSIRNVGAMCVELGLLDQGGRLTAQGAKATNSKYFDEILAHAIKRTFQKRGTFN